MTAAIYDGLSPVYRSVREQLSREWLLIGLDGFPNERRTTWRAVRSDFRTQVEYTAPIGEFPTTLLALVGAAEERLARRAAWSRRFDVALVLLIVGCGIATIVAQWAG